ALRQPSRSSLRSGCRALKSNENPAHSGMPFSGNRLNSLFVALAICLPASGISVAEERDIRLPDIGDPASAVLSRAEEQQLGTIILGQIRNSFPVIDDPELNTYIQSLGTRLITEGLDSELLFHFLLIDDPNINAFATPGGVISVHSGLLVGAANESELAGVVAHEIAHVEQRHMARTYANAGKINIATALGVLASIAAGMLDPNLGAAAVQGTLAASAQAQLAFSRSNEREADRVGMQLLTAAGYNPNGMPSFFEKLQKANQLNAGPALEFLSTHPVTLSRISDTRNRAEQLIAEGRRDYLNDTETFRFAKARLLALGTSPTALIDQARKKTLNRTDSYAYAIALTRNGDVEQAIAVLDKLVETDPDNLWLQLALAQAYMKSWRLPKATELLRDINEIYPNQEAVVYYLAQSLLDQEKGGEALRILDTIPVQRVSNPALYKLRAEAGAQAGQPWLSHEALADYYLQYGHFSAALEQLELALQGRRINTVAQARIRVKRKELKKLDEK
ncbi:MAG: M48 family metalloprotease, partial [Pseudomonadota bacterium]|nr:M48 family metalloprotease [Pseudomonadota bacterium]